MPAQAAVPLSRAGMTGPAHPPVTVAGGPAPIPWRRAFALLGALRGGVLAMGGLTVGGVLIGLVPPLVLGALVNALVARHATAQAALLAGLVALAMVLEAGAYIASDGLYARNASRLYQNLRLQMFGGALQRRAVSTGEQTAGLPSRFISDAETLERMTLALLDRGVMAIVELLAALVALAVLEPWTVAVVIPSLAVTWLIAQRVQQPTAAAGQQRQEQLEAMTRTLSGLLDGRAHQPDGATSRFRAATERVMAAEIRLGWLRALNLQGSGGMAKLGAITPVLAAALLTHHQAGTLMAIYLLAQRVFWGFDGLVDLRLDTQSVRGAVARCFELIDTPPYRPLDKLPIPRCCGEAPVLALPADASSGAGSTGVTLPVREPGLSGPAGQGLPTPDARAVAGHRR